MPRVRTKPNMRCVRTKPNMPRVCTKPNMPRVCTKLIYVYISEHGLIKNKDGNAMQQTCSQIYGVPYGRVKATL